jgi:hypothetical protein
MVQYARLITPRGKTIELTPEIYKQVRELLARQSRRRPRVSIDQAIRATYGKYAGGDSLTQALLGERTAERAREEAKIARAYD